MWVPINSENHSGSSQVVRCHSKNQSLNSESCSENTPELSESSENVGVAQTVFLVNRIFCPLRKRGRFDENGENDEFAFYPLKTRVSLLRPPKTTKMTKMAGVTREKAWFRKNLVCSSLRIQWPFHSESVFLKLWWFPGF